LCLAVVLDLGLRLYRFWQRYRPCFRTRTRDTSEQAYAYLRAQLTMDRNRNFKNIDRRLNGGDGQAVQHFMSNSPWPKAAVFDQIQSELTAVPVLAHDSLLILDESANAKAGTHNVGAARQYNGRLGKVDVCRVETCLTYAHVRAGLWTMVDGELYLPEEWFGEAFTERRQTLGVPDDRVFQSKTELGLQMVARAQANGLPFDRLACDAFYGKDRQFRADLQAKNVRYAADVPADTRVYLREPRVGVPRKRHRRGRPPTCWKVLSWQTAHEVRTLARSTRTVWQRVRVRPTERGWLEAEFAVQRVWTITEAGEVRAEWLVIRREAEGDCSYTLLNDPADTPGRALIEASCGRYFTERLFEDGKTEIGWDEFQAQKYRASEHHLALTALALWFVAETKLGWAQTYARDPDLTRQFELEVLPALSTANVRELLKAVLPVPHLTPNQAIHVVVHMLVDRARSIRSRLKAQSEHEAPT
jgi:SRSO17 transposase